MVDSPFTASGGSPYSSSFVADTPPAASIGFGQTSKKNVFTQTPGYSSAFPQRMTPTKITLPSTTSGSNMPSILDTKSYRPSSSAMSSAFAPTSTATNFGSNWLTELQQSKPGQSSAFITPTSSTPNNFFSTQKINQNLQASISPTQFATSVPKAPTNQITGSIISQTTTPTPSVLPPTPKVTTPIDDKYKYNYGSFFDPVTGLGYSVDPVLVAREKMLAETPGIYFNPQGKGFSIAPSLLNQISVPTKKEVAPSKAPIVESPKEQPAPRQSPSFGMSSMYDFPSSQIPFSEGFIKATNMTGRLPPEWYAPNVTTPKDQGMYYDSKTGQWKYPTTMNALTPPYIDAQGNKVKEMSVWDAAIKNETKVLTPAEKVNKEFWKEVWNIDLDKTAKMTPQDFIAEAGGVKNIIPYRATPLKETMTYRTPEAELKNQKLMETYYGPVGRVLSGGKGLTFPEWYDSTIKGLSKGYSKAEQGASWAGNTLANEIDLITGTKIGTKGIKTISKGVQSTNLAIESSVMPASLWRDFPTYGVPVEQGENIAPTYSRQIGKLLKGETSTDPFGPFKRPYELIGPAGSIFVGIPKAWNYYSDIEKAKPEYEKALELNTMLSQQAQIDFAKKNKEAKPILEDATNSVDAYNSLYKEYEDKYSKYPIDPETGSRIIPKMSKDYVPATEMSKELQKQFAQIVPKIEKSQLLVNDLNILGGQVQGTQNARTDMEQSGLSAYQRSIAEMQSRGKNPLAFKLASIPAKGIQYGLIGAELNPIVGPVLGNVAMGTAGKKVLELGGIGLGGLIIAGGPSHEANIINQIKYKNPKFIEGESPESERYLQKEATWVDKLVGLGKNTAEVGGFTAGAAGDLKVLNPLTWELTPLKVSGALGTGEAGLSRFKITRGEEVIPGKTISWQWPFGASKEVGQGTKLLYEQIPQTDALGNQFFKWTSAKKITPEAIRTIGSKGGILESKNWVPNNAEGLTLGEWTAKYGAGDQITVSGKAGAAANEAVIRATMTPEQIAEYEAKIGTMEGALSALKSKPQKPGEILDLANVKNIANAQEVGLPKPVEDAIINKLFEKSKGTSSYLTRVSNDFLAQFGMGPNKVQSFYGGISRTATEPGATSPIQTSDVDLLISDAEKFGNEIVTAANKADINWIGTKPRTYMNEKGQVVFTGNNNVPYKLFDAHDPSMLELVQPGLKLGKDDIASIKAKLKSEDKLTGVMSQTKAANIQDLTEAVVHATRNPLTGKYEFGFASARVNPELGASKDEIGQYFLAKDIVRTTGIDNPYLPKLRKILISKYGEGIIPELDKYSVSTLNAFMPGKPVPAPTITAIAGSPLMNNLAYDIQAIANPIDFISGKKGIFSAGANEQIGGPGLGRALTGMRNVISDFTPSGWGKGFPKIDFENILGKQKKLVEETSPKTKEVIKELPENKLLKTFESPFVSNSFITGGQPYSTYSEYAASKSPSLSTLQSMSPSIVESPSPSPISPSPSPSPYPSQYIYGSGSPSGSSSYSVSISGSVSPSPSPSGSPLSLLKGLPPFALPYMGLLGGDGDKGQQGPKQAVRGVNVNFLRNFFFDKVQVEKPIAMKGNVMLSGTPKSLMVGGAGRSINVGGNLAEALGKNFNTKIVSNTTPFEKKSKKRKVGKF